MNELPNHVELDANNHMEADECRLRLAYDDAGIDPRILKSAEVYVYLGDDEVDGEPESLG